MPLEIERKFLIKNDTWRPAVVRSERLQDGLVAVSDGRKVRVRLYERRATLTVKSKQEHGRRAEFEYEIPRDHAEEMLQSHCGGNTIGKTRHYVSFGGLQWEIDVYDGWLQGVVLGEVELDHIDQPVPLPDWVGEEVTGRREFKKIEMLKARRAAAER
ncbi:MAG: CYTH domain-containing protein [Hyphomicrobiaceae bacterium]